MRYYAMGVYAAQVVTQDGEIVGDGEGRFDYTGSDLGELEDHVTVLAAERMVNVLEFWSGADVRITRLTLAITYLKKDPHP